MDELIGNVWNKCMNACDDTVQSLPIKTVYPTDKLRIPYLRGACDIVSFATHAHNCIRDPRWNRPVASAIMASNAVSFVYHKIPCDETTDLLLQVVDNYLIAVRTHVIAEQAYGDKFRNLRRLGLLYSTIMVFTDYENYSSNNHCIAPFITVVPNVLTEFDIQKLSIFLNYAHGFEWYMMEYNPPENSKYDFGRFLRGGQWVSNHEIFHVLLCANEMELMRVLRIK